MKAAAPGGTVYIVSTPIGNLKDITYRAVEVLAEVPLIAAEDTRHTRKLLRHYRIATPTISYYEHNRFSRLPQILRHLEAGRDIALVTDAGTPGISDPAYRLIREAITAGCRIESIPGASAFLAGLVSSGLPTDRFRFEGFLPTSKGRRKRLKALAEEQATIILYENPRRLVGTLQDVLDVLGDRPAAVGRELTKIHEAIIRGTVSEIISYFKQNTPRGELVVVIGKDDPNVYFP